MSESNVWQNLIRIIKQSAGNVGRVEQYCILRFLDQNCFLRYRNENFYERHHDCMNSIQGLLTTESNSRTIMNLYPNLFRVERNHKVHLKYTTENRSLKMANYYYLPWGVKALEVKHLWPTTRGEGVKIAIIDTGVDAQHPDLRHSIQGGVNLLSSYSDSSIFDDNGHGTHIAGTISAMRLGGLMGVAPLASIYSIKAFDKNGDAYISDIIRAIDWAIAQRMHIINMSFGMPFSSDALHDAIKQAAASGIMIIASSGNGGYKDRVDFPAKYEETLSVAAVNRKYHVSSFSKVGHDVDVYAPGEEIISTWPGGKYMYLNGSSMATAHVSGLLALLTHFYGVLSMSQWKSMFLANHQTNTPYFLNASMLFEKSRANKKPLDV